MANSGFRSDARLASAWVNGVQLSINGINFLGGVESSAHSLKFLLQNPGRGRLIGIVIGGAEEVLDAHPGSHELNLLGRRGFCRFALEMG